MKLLKSTALVGTMTLISRILGLVREIVFARFFGATGQTDAFFVAFKIPNFLRRLFAEGSFSLAFVPVLSEYREQGDRQALKSLIDAVTGTLAAVLLVITAIGVLAAPALLAIFVPGWVADGRDSFGLAANMLRVTFPYAMLISLTALGGGILNSFERFLVPALTPALLNISFIVAAIGFAVYFDPPEMVLAWAVLTAGVLQLLFQIPALARHGLVPKPRWGWRHPGVQKILKLMLPTLLGSSVAQINLLFDTLIASFLIAGSVSWLNYSDRLLEFPIGVFGVALSTVILPTLSRKHARQDATEFSHTLDWALRLSVLITIPAAVGLAILAKPMLSSLFQYQAFNADDVVMSAYALVAYAAGLPAFIAIKVLEPGFYARQDTRTPVRIAVTALITNMGLNLIFVGGLIWMGFKGPHAGLALASSAAAYLNAGLLYRNLRRRSIYIPQPGWPKLLAAVMGGCLAMTLMLTWASPDLSVLSAADARYRIGSLTALIGSGAALYFVVSILLGLRFKDLQRGAN